MAQDNDEAAPGRRPVAFISHHSSQEKTARHLKTVLERNGVTGWMAPDDIDPGVAFDQAIIEQVERSDLIVLLFCAKSDQSRHVKRELMMAENNKKLIYPVRLEDIDAKGLAYWLNDYQWIDWIDRRDATIQKMIETVKKQVGYEDVDDHAVPAEDAEADTPGDTPPVGLMGGDGGAADGPPRFAGIPLNRNGWIAIGGVAVLAAILLGLAVNALTSNSVDNVRPGRWQTSYVVDRILERPDTNVMSETQLDTFLANFESNSAIQCITEADARSPGNDFFDPERENNCAMSNLTWENGRFRVQLECEAPSLDGITLNIWMRGTYTEENMETEAEYAWTDAASNELRIVANQNARYLGPCE
ncbi:TIR domain-containing protein [Parasphingopyxis lamellibrachiae]|uniref:Uncharacterized protein DUF3617 n=1 Tax=Parasphingopyxis lamellibrachiae TaxID=680125 RepID=A0A3D9FGG6_9SPHN|nr:TIR domain-containing protein [Parasphingopyxis lamellibrachiae]RED16900.1 uncharacterized protein DUF3617 [Parasphingopyxis lamellibrachiae]